MSSAIIIDERGAFLSDINTRQLVEDEREVKVVDTLNSLERLKGILDRNPDVSLIVISDAIARKQANWNYGNRRVVGYALSQEGEQELAKRNIPSLGVVIQGGQLLDLINQPLPINQPAADTAPTPVPYTQPPVNPVAEEPETTVVEENQISPADEKTSVQPTPIQQPSSGYPSGAAPTPQNGPAQYSQPGYPNGVQGGYPPYPPQMSGYPGWGQQMTNQPPQPTQPAQPGQASGNKQGGAQTPPPYYPGYYPAQNGWQNQPPYQNYWYPPYGYPQAQPGQTGQPGQQLQQAQPAKGAPTAEQPQQSYGQAPYPQPDPNAAYQTPSRVDLTGAEQFDNQRAAQEMFQQDFIPKQRVTTVVAVYAAKGGVGKTTVATETAVYLALTSNGRNRYRTCIVDYNIDFGDVEAVLFKEMNKSANLYHWALDIKDRMAKGEDPKRINYTKREMEQYLRVMENTGLYVLCAPSTHQESMGVESVELEVMLRNLKEHGDFDFIICDTGNNTRDSSIIALEAADYVLLVATQDFTTASCNSSVIDALNRFGLDLKKVRLVINNMMSVKYTGIPAKDVENYFSDFPCIARIRHDLDVVKANNLNQPIVLDANHAVTKEFRHIIAFLTSGEIQETERKSRFSFFRRKK